MAVSGTISGLEPLLKKLKTLEPKIAKKVLRQSLRAGAKIIQTAAKAKAPVKSGQLRKAIKVRAQKRTRRGTIGVNVSVGEKDFAGEVFYGSFIEFGSSKMPARPFMKPAFQENKAAALQVIQDGIAAGIEEAAKS